MRDDTEKAVRKGKLGRGLRRELDRGERSRIYLKRIETPVIWARYTNK